MTTLLDPQNLIYAALTVVVTVVFVIVVRVFGNLPVSLVGPDLNLLTYGFLWETSAKALRGAEYWPRFEPLFWNINRPTTLFAIAFLNLILLGANLKLAYRVESMKSTTQRKWLWKPIVNALGVLSLILFLLIHAAWEAN